MIAVQEYYNTHTLLGAETRPVNASARLHTAAKFVNEVIKYLD